MTKRKKPNTPKVERILVIGDAHNAPKQSIRRFVALNRWIVQQAERGEPLSEIVIIGDWIDLGSLSRFDTVGSKALEGTRVRADVESGKVALRALTAGLDVPIVFCEGNH